MEIDLKKIVWVQVINENQIHVNIDGIGIKLLEFNKMDINGVTYKNSDEFVAINKLTIFEEDGI
jgi:ribosomal protein S12